MGKSIDKVIARELRAAQLRRHQIETVEKLADFPVTGLHASFDEAYAVFRAAAAPLSLDEQRALFFTTANETYRLGMGEHHV